MKLATILNKAKQMRVAAISDDCTQALDLRHAFEIVNNSASSDFYDMLALIDAGVDGLDKARMLVERWPDDASIPLSEIILQAPLPIPRSMRDCLVFEQHLINFNAQRAKVAGQPAAAIPPVWYERPSYYKGNRFSVVGPEAEISWPSYSKLIDFELELACIIGKKGKDIARKDAMSHIFGFTIFNDFSARDVQVVEKTLNMGSTKAKDFDTGNALGPWIVTVDEIDDPHKLRMDARVNGARWGGGNSADMHHKFEDIVAFISRSETLYPGEVIASGTVGTGCGMEIGRFLSPGDIVELEIEKIGILRNTISTNPERMVTSLKSLQYDVPIS